MADIKHLKKRSVAHHMLLSLPKDLLTYILGHVVYDYYDQEYVKRGGKHTHCHTTVHTTVFPIETEVNISLLTCPNRFDRSRFHSHMSNFMNMLSQVHPKIRELLKDVSVVTGQHWCFHEKLFVTSHRWVVGGG